MTSINIGGKERPVRMRMLAVRHFQKLTGKNIAGGKVSFTEIFGGKYQDDDGNTIDQEFNPELFVNFLFAVLADGMHPEKPDFTVDDVSAWVSLYDKTLVPILFDMWMEYMTGLSKEEWMKLAEKNLKAPQDGAATSLSGQTSSEQPTAS